VRNKRKKRSVVVLTLPDVAAGIAFGVSSIISAVLRDNRRSDLLTISSGTVLYFVFRPALVKKWIQARGN
jgi:hypothetical protein